MQTENMEWASFEICQSLFHFCSAWWTPWPLEPFPLSTFAVDWRLCLLLLSITLGKAILAACLDQKSSTTSIEMRSPRQANFTFWFPWRGHMYSLGLCVCVWSYEAQMQCSLRHAIAKISTAIPTRTFNSINNCGAKKQCSHIWMGRAIMFHMSCCSVIHL